VDLETSIKNRNLERVKYFINGRNNDKKKRRKYNNYVKLAIPYILEIPMN